MIGFPQKFALINIGNPFVWHEACIMAGGKLKFSIPEVASSNLDRAKLLREK